MQGPPTPMAPPLKKVRADAATTSPNNNAVSRRDQLEQLQKGLTNYSSSVAGSSALSSAMGGPPLGGGVGVGVGAPPLGGGSSTAYSAGPPLGVGGGPPRGATYTASNPMINRYSTAFPTSASASSYTASSSLSSSIPPDSGPPPAIPGRSGPAAAMRTSDIFPSVPKTAMANIGSSISSSNISAPPPPSVARRLDDSLAKAQSSGSNNNNNTAPPGVGFVGGGPPSRPKSAPPRRPPPPPPVVRPTAVEAPEGDRHTVRRPPPLIPTAAGPTPPPAAPRSAPLPPMRPPSMAAPPPTPTKTATATAGPPKTNPQKKDEKKQQPEDNSSEPSLKAEAAAAPPPPVGLQTPVPKTAKNDKVGGGGVVAFSEATPQFISPGPNMYSPGEPERTSGGHDGVHGTPAGGPSVSTAHAGQTPYPGKKSISSSTAHAGQTPYPVKILGGPAAPSSTDTDKSGGVISSSSTSRRDIVRGMYDIADTPLGKNEHQLQQQQSSPPQSSSPPSTSMALKINESHELRLQKELARSEKAKAGAFHKVSDLEDELRQVKLELAAQKTPGRDNKQHSVGFLSPVALGGGSSSNLHGMTLPQRQRRVPTPHPKRLYKNGDNNNNNIADISFIKTAVECVPHEFVYDSVAFIIRRPFGFASSDNQQFWAATGQAPSHMYDKKVNIRDTSTVEIAAQIALDNSVFFLYGEGMVRHQTLVNGKQKWKDLGNALESDQALGNVMYIDSEANEKEYSLDDIFEQALCVRENYCAAITSTSLGFQQQQEMRPAAVMTAHQSPLPGDGGGGGGPAVLSPLAEEHHKPEVNDACVGTEELEYKPQQPPQQQQPQDGNATQQQQEQMQGSGAAKEASGQVAPPHPPPPMDDGSADILSSFLGFFLSTIFSILWYIAIKLPVKIFETVIVLSIGILIVSLIWLYLSDDHGAAAQGFAINSYYWNPPGIV